MSANTSRILSAIMFQVSSRPSIESIGIDRYRQLLEKSARVFKTDPDILIKKTDIGGIEAEWLTPAAHHARRIILYVHGGGFIAGSILSHRDLASRIAKASQSQLLLFNYRLAPEHPFPEGLNDVLNVYQWLLDQGHSSQDIHIAGDSAGGGLALSLVCEICNNNQPIPGSVTLLSPWIDLRCSNDSYTSNQKKDFMLTQESLDRTVRYYTDQDPSNPRISPVLNSFEGMMPPFLIQVGENELLLDDSRQLADKIKAAGGDVILEVWDQMFHVWHYFAKYLSEGREAIDRIGSFISSHA